jgi:lipopolysaccharide cholinephosphotransferase
MDFDLKALQSKELLILKEVKRICEKHSIDYFLCFGTLLGAVRHQGFIPWDDDIDIAMTYNNLIKFREVCKTELDSNFFLQNENTEPNSGLTFDKIRMNNTTLIAKNMASRDMHHGIDIDIYPLFNVPDGSFKRKMQLLASAIYMLFVVGEKPIKASRPLRFISSIALLFFRGRMRTMMKKKCHTYMAKFENSNCENKAFLCCNLRACKRMLRSEYFEKYTDMKFEDDNFLVPQGYDHLLKTWYGNYMIPTPIEEQVIKLGNVVFVDIENTYLKYKGIYYCNK